MTEKEKAQYFTRFEYFTRFKKHLIEEIDCFTGDFTQLKQSLEEALNVINDHQLEEN
jgi:hypothetical protein